MTLGYGSAEQLDAAHRSPWRGPSVAGDVRGDARTTWDGGVMAGIQSGRTARSVVVALVALGAVAMATGTGPGAG